MGNSKDNTDVVILAAARTPQGRLNGQLASFTAVELGAHAIRSAIAASGVDAGRVDAVIMGQVLQAAAMALCRAGFWPASSAAATPRWWWPAGRNP